MISLRCQTEVRKELKKMGLHCIEIEYGAVEILESISRQQWEQLDKALRRRGFELLDDDDSIKIENVKKLIAELIYCSDGSFGMNHADYLCKKLNCDYDYLSLLFSERYGVTLAKYISQCKIEWIKEMLLYEDISLIEIACRFGYSSVWQLSFQFRQITGLTVSYFLQIKQKRRELARELANS